ncbi:MAG: serine/threonine-protein phosphatase [Oscillospiraceae bacterium]|nr:serine/threonine-protein phosphatase [Oscillospiraceae bacterium]
MRIEYSVRSHVGWVRENNEDNFAVNGATLPANLGNRPFFLDGIAEYPAVFAVCDGMGGEDDGEIASRLMANTVLQFEDEICHAGKKKLNRIVQDCVRDADAAIRASVGRWRQSGTTLAMAVISRQGAFCFNLGDSRIYALCGKNLHRVSHDHTWFAEHMKDTDQIPKRRGKLYKLTGCLGIGEHRDAEAYPPVKGKYRILLCSDGLTDRISGEEIQEILNSCTGTDKAADALLSLALDKGGHDNITIIVADGRTTFPAFTGRGARGGKRT